MKKQNYHSLADRLEKKWEKRDVKKKRKMKVSGAKVKELQKIISEK